MKVGGNESATRYFQSHGGSAALASKDPTTKYTSNAAVKYKDELKRRATADAQEFPGEVIITDIPSIISSDGSATPSGDPESDFFSSWDKPSIKRPTPPISRTSTPGIGRTPSPFLSAGVNGITARPKSPLVGTGDTMKDPATPNAQPSRTTSSNAIRKGAPLGGARKANILGAKKTQKLGAKKITGADAIDFDAAEKKAKEEADRIAKLGYDPDAEDAVSAKAKNNASTSAILSPSPVSPAKGVFGATKGKERSSSEMERLGMGVGRLGFGQVGGAKPAQPQKKMGFGSAGTSKPVEDDNEKYARQKFGTQKGISSDEFFGRNNFDPSAQREAKGRLQGFEGATSISSNAYFGRPEDDEQGADEYGNYGDLEGAAKDFVRKFGVTAGDDLENLTQVLGEGASKLQNAVRTYLNS
ncbi:MAG: ADP-ribosylation factor GTPase activating protein, ER-Golgi transport [Trizodia sp. TS-e1964]|nr:MAG: ADP-ribosylation factor GTPase activating protein, ER-Golgi transport [Trizodia sp. TS-e1964]